MPDTTQMLSSSPSNIPSHLQNISSASPSLAVHCDAIVYQHQIETKNIKAKKINKLANILDRKCPICWAYDPNNLKPNHTKNGLFIKCNPNSSEFIPHLLGWIDLKKKMKFPPFQYCYNCHFPQTSQYLPTCHPAFGVSKDASKFCPLADSVILLVWFIRHTDKWWSKAVLVFPTLVSNMDEASFVAWLNSGESLTTFYNGLELVLWFFQKHHL